MSNIKSRLDKLEDANLPDRERKTWVIVKGETDPQGIDPDDVVIRVLDEQTRELVQRILAGEGT
jgi:hypothetical protein